MKRFSLSLAAILAVFILASVDAWAFTPPSEQAMVSLADHGVTLAPIKSEQIRTMTVDMAGIGFTLTLATMLLGTIAEPPATPKHKKRPELYTGDIKLDQKADVPLPLDAPLARPSDIVLMDDERVTKDYLDALNFAEEPVTILIHLSNDERLAQKTTDLVANNGVLAEILCKNGWVQYGYLPRGIAITVKRKTCEDLARSKSDNVTTSVIRSDDGDMKNAVQRFTTVKTPFSVLEDRSPKGAAWLQSIVRQQA